MVPPSDCSDGLGDGPGVGAATGAGSEDGAAVPRSSAPAQFVPEPVPAGAGAAALSAAVAAQAGVLPRIGPAIVIDRR